MIIVFANRLQNGGVQKAALLRTGPVHDAKQEESNIAEWESLPKEDRLHRAQGHEQLLTTVALLESPSFCAKRPLKRDNGEALGEARQGQVNKHLVELGSHCYFNCRDHRP